MVTFTAFRRRLTADGRQVDVELPAGRARWVAAQEHCGQNIGDTPSHSIFVELKEPAVVASPAASSSPAATPGPPALGPSPA